MKARNVKYIFFGVILVVCIGIIYTNIIGENQDETFKQDFILYHQAMQLMQDNQLEQAETAMEELIKKYPDEYLLYYQFALSLSSRQDFEKASIHYQKAINIRPALLQDPTFTFSMGESLYHINQFEAAKTYLSYPVPEQFQSQKDQLLQAIEEQI